MRQLKICLFSQLSELVIHQSEKLTERSFFNIGNYVALKLSKLSSGADCILVKRNR